MDALVSFEKRRKHGVNIIYIYIYIYIYNIMYIYIHIYIYIYVTGGHFGPSSSGGLGALPLVALPLGAFFPSDFRFDRRRLLLCGQVEKTHPSLNKRREHLLVEAKNVRRTIY